MSGPQVIGPGKAVDTSGWEGIGGRRVEAIIGCLIGGSSIGDHAGRTGITSPGTGSVSIGIAATDRLCWRQRAIVVLAFPVQNTNVMTGVQHA